MIECPASVQNFCLRTTTLHSWWRTAESSAHSLETCGQLRVFLLDFELCTGSLGVGNSVDHFALSACELGGPGKVFKSFSDLALLQEKLGHSANGNITFGVDYCELALRTSTIQAELTDQSLLAQALSLLEILLPLENTKSLVDQRQHIDCSRLSLALHLNSLVELLDSSLVILLVEQKLTVVVVYIRHCFELLH